MPVEHTPAEYSPAEYSLGEGKPGPLLRWFRFSEGRDIARVLVRGAGFVLLGNLIVGAAILLGATGPRGAMSTELLLPRAPLPLVLGLLLTGILVTALGPGLVIWKLRHYWARDQYLALHTDGIRYLGQTQGWFVPWDNIKRIGVNEAGCPCLWLENGELRTVSERFSSPTAQDVVTLMSALHRKAAFGLSLRS